jgi:hypothetical protein
MRAIYSTIFAVEIRNSSLRLSLGINAQNHTTVLRLLQVEQTSKVANSGGTPRVSYRVLRIVC